MFFNKIKRISTIVDRILLPDSASSDELGRKRLFILLLMMLIAPLVIFGTIHFKNGRYSYWIIDHGAAVVLTGFIIALRYMENGRIMYRASLIMAGTMLFYWLITGAIVGYSSIWILAFPLFSFFLTGRREGLFWTAIMTSGTILVFMNPFSLFDVWRYPPEYVLRHLFTLFIILLFTYSYESVRERFKKAIEKEQGLLFMEKEHLAAAKFEVDEINERLSDEMEVRKTTEDELRKHRDHLEEIVEERTRELQRNNLELEESEKRYRLLANNVNDLIWSLDLNFKILYVSPSVASIYGYSLDEAQSLSMRDIHTPESFNKMMNKYLEQMEIEKSQGSDPERNVVMQLEHRHRDGTLFDVEIRASFFRDESGRPVGIVGITRDISERVRAQRENEKMQEQLAQAQKMEAIGTLVGGLAHDFNNILSGILGSFDLLDLYLKKEKLEERDSIEKYLNVGMESTKRSVNLIKELLALSQRHEIKLEPLEINQAVSHIYDLCYNSFPKSIELDFKYALERPIIMGDMVQIGQVLLNLCINASHAMTIMRKPEERQGGKLSVVVDVTDPDHLADWPGGTVASPDHAWVRIRVSDTGVGIDRETITRIYEPFFTKKKRDEGSGLGLSISYNIIQKHGGLIRVYSEPGAGSSFSLFFPLCKTDADSGRSCSVESDLVSGTGTILIIDDERMVLKVARGFLDQCGYTVITAETPDAGIEIFRERHASISAVLIDLSMPGKSGLEVFKELKEIDPSVRAILSSGMLDNESKERAIAMGFMDFANKPYLARELSVKIQNILD